MEQESPRIHGAFKRDSDLPSIDSSIHGGSFRTASLDRIGNSSSFRGGPISLSHGCSESRQDSLSSIRSRSSWRKGSVSLSRVASDRILESISLSRELTNRILGDVDCSIVAQVGDSGDRIVGDIDREDEDDVKYANVFLPDNALIYLSSPVSPTDAIRHSTEKDQIQRIQSSSPKGKQYKLPPRLDYISNLIHLAVFGIFGVLTRYFLEKLFGPSLLGLTGNNSALYLDLPSNMLGSFLMGWVGIVFKADIRHVSDHLMVGLTTGYMGSLTTFSGWNQKMLDLSSKGHWASAVGGIIVGMFMVNESIRVGVESAEWFRGSVMPSVDMCLGRTKWRVDSPKRHTMVMIIMLVVLGSLWSLSVVLARAKLDDVTNGAVLWLGCLVGPPGVWARWYLARLNGQGLGSKGLLKWLPFGTLSANVLAACLMAALGTISNAVNTKRCEILVSGVQLGFLGCLSTVSTFVAEVHALRQIGHPGRALAYTAATILPSFALGTLIYSVPVWTKHYK